MITTSIVSSFLEYFSLLTLGHYRLIENTFLPIGPYSLLASLFLQFHLCIPYVSYARLFSIPLSLKLLPTIIFTQVILYMLTYSIYFSFYFDHKIHLFAVYVAVLQRSSIVTICSIVNDGTLFPTLCRTFVQM